MTRPTSASTAATDRPLSPPSVGRRQPRTGTSKALKSHSLLLTGLLLTGLWLNGCGGPNRDLHQVEAGDEPVSENGASDDGVSDDGVSDDGASDEATDTLSEAVADEGSIEAWKRNRIAWTTASEVDNFGYDVYRGDAEDGPFVRVTEQPLPGHGTTDEPSDYVFFDTTIEPDTVYWYYVESISLDGARERFTPIFPSKPKLPPEPAPEG